ncbi:MAG: hypothetical protein WBA93_14720 [Microcoleaceae cyanobacterium]
MKKLHVMATVLSTVAIAGGVVFSSSAEACIFSGKYKNSESGNSLISLNSWLTKILPGKSNLVIGGVAGTLGLTGLGALYASRRLARKAEANVDATNESMEVLVEEPVVQQHPEAPGGYLDLVEDKVTNTQSEVIADRIETETTLLK